MDLEDIYMLVRAMERDATTLVEAFPRLHRSQRDHLLHQHLGHRITETERALRALRQECETCLFGDEVKRLAHLRDQADWNPAEHLKEATTLVGGPYWKCPTCTRIFRKAQTDLQEVYEEHRVRCIVTIPIGQDSGVRR